MLYHADTGKMIAFEMDCKCYWRALGKSSIYHRTKESILYETRMEQEVVITVKMQKLHHFGHVLRVKIHCRG